MGRRVNGSGSVFRRKSDGLWIAQVSSGPRGQRRYIIRSGRTKAAALEALAEVRGALSMGITPSRETTGAYLERWVSDVRDIRPTTRAGYRAVVAYHLQPTVGSIPLSDLSAIHVERMLATLTPTMSRKSLRNVHAVLRRALGMALRAGLVSRNVASREFIDAPKVEMDEPEALTDAQLDAILAASADDRLAALFLAAADTGLRQGELLGLAWEDIDGDWIRVRKELVYRDGRYSREDPKTRLSKRRVPLPPRVVGALAKHRQSVIAEGFVPTATGPVFVNTSGKPLSGSWVTHHFYAICEAAGIDRRPFKILRATYGSRLFEAGVPEPTIAQLMGHARTHTTRRHYIHRTEDQAIAAVARLANSHAVVTEDEQEPTARTRRAVS